MALDISENLIVGIDDFKFYSGASENVSARYITAAIIQTQDIYCQGILGTALTQKLIADYNAGTLTGLYDELYNSAKCSVKKMVIAEAYRYVLDQLNVRISNGSIQRDENAISNADLQDLKQSKAALVIRYENQVKKFIMENWNDIPELVDDTPEYIEPDTNKSDNTQGFADVDTIYYSDL